MKINKKATEQCRVCGKSFCKEPLLVYENMPAAAQYLPGAKMVKQDKGVKLEVCQCSGCGLVQLNNEPVPYYKEVIRAAGASNEMKAFRLRQFTAFVNKYHLRDKKVFEIGCGRGEYLSLMKQAGTDVYGLEHAKSAVQECLASGLKVRQGFINNANQYLSGAPFAAFFIMNFLEHLPEPNVVLRGMRSNLTEQGVGLIEVPNFDMMIKKKLFSEFIGDHLLYFTQATLSNTLKNNGFAVVESGSIWHDYIISAVVKRAAIKPQSFKPAARTDLTSFIDQRNKVKTDIDNYLKQYQDKKIAVWGGGHQALAILSLMELGDKIKYIVDSAPFKQNKFTPATHIPIVAPDTLDSDPVDVIIVMAASYSDEVAGIIRRKFGRSISVAILRDSGLEVV